MPHMNQHTRFAGSAMIIAIIFSILIIGSLLTTGCGGWNGGKIQRDQDIRITKLDPDGVMEWTTLIDTGNYDFGLDFTQTPDGGFMVIGGTAKLACQNFPQAPEIPQLTRLSATGETLWQRDYPIHIAEVIPNRDGNLSAISDPGKIIQLDPDGKIINEYDPGINKKPTGIWVNNNSFSGLKEGYYLFPGLVIVRVNSSDSFSWVQMNGSIIGNIFSIVEIPETKGYLALVNDNNGAKILRLDIDGNILGVEPVGLFSETPKPVIYHTSEGFSVVLDEFGSFKGYLLDRQGAVRNNISIITRDAAIPLNEGGFISFSKTDPGDRITKTIYNPDGTIASKKTSNCPIEGCPILYGDIIPTSDGGYAIMSLIKKEREC